MDRDKVVGLFFPLILYRLTTFFAGGIFGISSFWGAGTSGTGVFGDTSIGSDKNIATGISSVSYITSIGNSSIFLSDIFNISWPELI